MINEVLPDPPDDLAGVRRDFYDRFRAAMATERLGALRPEDISVKFGESAEIEISHAERAEWRIRVYAEEDWITVFVGDAHEDFHAHVDDSMEAAAVRAVEFILDALHGNIEVRSTWRGDEILSTRYIRRSAEGIGGGHAGFLSPGQLKIWKSKRRVVQRPSWE